LRRRRYSADRGELAKEDCDRLGAITPHRHELRRMRLGQASWRCHSSMRFSQFGSTVSRTAWRSRFSALGRPPDHSSDRRDPLTRFGDPFEDHGVSTPETKVVVVRRGVPSPAADASCLSWCSRFSCFRPWLSDAHVLALRATGKTRPACRASQFESSRLSWVAVGTARDSLSLEPSCSTYGLEAYETFEFTTAIARTLSRVVRCNLGTEARS
jgi:hypothetical protein